MSDQRIDLLVVAREQELVDCGRAIADAFSYRMTSFPDVDALAEAPDGGRARVVLLSALEVTQREAIAGHVQVARQLCPDSFIVCVVSKAMPPELAEFMKKSGANLILLEDEALGTSKIEFICSQTLHSTFLPVKADELTPGANIDFDLYHLLPLRGKFLPCQYSGDVLSQERITKIAQVGELYVHREQADAYRLYVERHADRSAAGLARRCRAQFVSLNASFVDLIYHMTDRSEHASFARGQELLQECKELASSLAISLGAVGNAWQIINQTSIGGFGSVERAPAIAAYGALFALRAGNVSVDEVMLGALFADIGLIGLRPRVIQCLREDRLADLTPEERKEYELHPLLSVDLLLSRRLPLTPTLRQVILTTHERPDGSGFPKGMQGKKLPAAAELIQLAEAIDAETGLRMGRARVDGSVFAQEFLRRQFTGGTFSPELVAKLVG